jgi:hypothetical protein
MAENQNSLEQVRKIDNSRQWLPFFNYHSSYLSYLSLRLVFPWRQLPPLRQYFLLHLFTDSSDLDFRYSNGYFPKHFFMPLRIIGSHFIKV